MDAEKSQKIGWGRAFSSIRVYVEKRTPAIFALVVIALMSANLYGTIRAVRFQEMILARGVVAQKPQELVAEWRSRPGLTLRVYTPRNVGESNATVAFRHAGAIEALAESYEPE